LLKVALNTVTVTLLHKANILKSIKEIQTANQDRFVDVDEIDTDLLYLDEYDMPLEDKVLVFKHVFCFVRRSDRFSIV